MTGSRFRPGHPCPEPGCPGHLEIDGEWPVVCDHCHWVPDDGGLLGHAVVAWLRRRATESIPPRTAAERRAQGAARCVEVA